MAAKGKSTNTKGEPKKPVKKRLPSKKGSPPTPAKTPSKELRSSPKTPSLVKKGSRSSHEARQLQSGFPIVGIGASAGGLEAFEEFFTQMSPNSGLAFVVVSH
ncbi:MAG: hypothetical protein H0W49_15405, partial [Nitrospirales bacterium]|nr:hypothetical protein [Nitrospirales bacterium]